MKFCVLPVYPAQRISARTVLWVLNELIEFAAREGKGVNSDQRLERSSSRPQNIGFNARSIRQRWLEEHNWDSKKRRHHQIGAGKHPAEGTDESLLRQPDGVPKWGPGEAECPLGWDFQVKQRISAEDAVTKLDGYRSYQAPTGKLRPSAGAPNWAFSSWMSFPFSL